MLVMIDYGPCAAICPTAPLALTRGEKKIVLMAMTVRPRIRNGKSSRSTESCKKTRGECLLLNVSCTDHQ